MTKTLPKITATFQPQAWINDYAVETDGRTQFDCTKTVLRLSLAEIKKLRDDQYETDNLLPDSVMGSHSGPFYVSVENAIDEFFDALGLKLDEQGLAAARKLYRVRGPKA
jgi:hypothetical protein